MPAHEQGAICFRYHGASSAYAADAVDCAMRLLIDCKLNNSNIAAVMVPDADLNRVANDVQSFGFSLVADNTLKTASQTSLRVLAYPTGTEQVFYYSGQSG
jgi:hypothetical protein